MTTIDTVEDLVRILEEKPEWLDRIRNLILTDELLRLPQRFDRLADKVYDLSGKVENLSDEFHTFADETNRCLSNLEDGQARLERRMDSLVDDVGDLKGARSEYVAERDYEVIALEMGFVRAALVSRADVFRIGMSPLVQYRGSDDLRSFRDADVVMEAVDAADQTTYIAVEASYTVDRRDTRRALRNAEILTEVKGLPALAAVCGREIDMEIEGTIASGDIHWHQFGSKDLAPR